jgi:SnoaL-like domain
MEMWELVARESCRDTLAQYTHAGDRALMDEYAAAFCEDGVLEIRGLEPARGRAAIVARVGGATASAARRAADDTKRSADARPAPGGDASPAAPRRIVRHNVTNIRFESVTPEEAVVASYFTVFTEIGLDHMGRYRDRLVPVGERWLIAHRFVSTDWRAPNTTFGGGPASS